MYRMNCDFASHRIAWFISFLVVFALVLCAAAMGEESSSTFDPKSTPLTFEAKENGVEIEVVTSLPYLKYSENGGGKQTWSYPITLNQGDIVQFYGKGYYQTRFSVAKGQCYIYGNIMSLVDETGFATATSIEAPYAFYKFFAGNLNLISHDTKKLVLPATTLKDGCYYGMFSDCTSLTTAPELPATTLKERCYEGMFSGCSSLTKAPELKAPKLANNCYTSMFQGCASLNNVVCLATDIKASGATTSWLAGVASTGTFTKASGTDWTSVTSSIPTNWTVQIAVDEVTLSPSTAQTMYVGDNTSFKATIKPDDATDKKVKWSVGGTNPSAVKLYSDSSCTTEVGTEATDILTVYAKGLSAGTATVTVTSNADSTKNANCSITVKKKDPTATAPTGLTATYGQTLADITLTNPSGNTPGTWSWADSSQEVGNPGIHTFKANFTPTDTTTYNSKTNVDVTVTVGRGESTVTKAPTANAMTYTGSSQKLVTAGEAKGGEMLYALGTDNKTAPTDGWSTTIPTGKDEGTYFVWYHVKGDENHTDTKPSCIEALINSYSCISGEGSQWTKSSGMPLNFQIKNLVNDSKTYPNFQGLQVDGKPLTRDKEYTASPGSVVIELKPTYLETLSVGEHTIRAVFTDGKAEAKFTVAAGTLNPEGLPQTGDSSNVFVYALIGLIALFGIVLMKRIH